MRSWGMSDLDELHSRSLDDPEWFWRAVVDDLDIEFSSPFDKVLDDGEGKEFPRWFVGGTLNVAQLCAHRHVNGPVAGKTAIAYEGDAGQSRMLTYAELDAQVRRFAANLVQLESAVATEWCSSCRSCPRQRSPSLPAR
jgi:acetyl-CoA synthetase